MNKLRNAMTYILGAIAVILGVLLSFRNRKLQRTEADLANALADKRITEADHDREIAKAHADALVNSYDDLKRRYDERAGGSGGDTEM